MIRSPDRQAIETVIAEVPALRQLKLVASLELRGRGDVQQFRIELPGPQITKDVAADARITVDMRREFFNAMSARARTSRLA